MNSVAIAAALSETPEVSPLKETTALDMPQVQLPQPAQPLVVTVDKKGQIFIEQQSVTLLDLKRRLPGLLQSHKGQAVYLKADEQVPYGSVVKVLDLLDEAGAPSIGLVTREGK